MARCLPNRAPRCQPIREKNAQARRIAPDSLGRGANPKSEGRAPKEIRSPNLQPPENRIARPTLPRGFPEVAACLMSGSAPSESGRGHPPLRLDRPGWRRSCRHSGCGNRLSRVPASARRNKRRHATSCSTSLYDYHSVCKHSLRGMMLGCVPARPPHQGIPNLRHRRTPHLIDPGSRSLFSARPARL